MKFDEINDAMNQQQAGDLKVPTSIDQLSASQLPIQKVRKRMVSEIITQLLVIVIFFSFPFVVKMHEQPRATYFILMFLTALMTLGYVLKMFVFVRETSQLQYNSKDTIQQFIFDLRILLETYKTAVIAGSLLLPVSMLAMFLGFEQTDLSLYNKVFMLQFTPLQLVLLVVVYLLLAVLMYVGTLKWSAWLYEGELKNLASVLAAYEDETIR